MILDRRQWFSYSTPLFYILNIACYFLSFSHNHLIFIYLYYNLFKTIQYSILLFCLKLFNGFPISVYIKNDFIKKKVY